MATLLVSLAQAALLTFAGHAEPALERGLRPPLELVRLECDQYCTCWRTRYQERRPMLDYRDDQACLVRQYDRAYYNNYYRAGPAVGLGFERRYRVREFPFPY